MRFNLLLLVAYLGLIVGIRESMSRLLLAPTPVKAGYRDFSFAAPEVSAPTSEKPQSKLWFNDGIWWGALFRPSTDALTINRFDWATKAWSNTGIVLDARHNARIDAMWDGSHLYVLGAGVDPTNSDDSAHLRRFSYNPNLKTFALDAGFPVTIIIGGMEAAVLDKDSTGTLWVTYTRDSAVYVTHSVGDDRTWVVPYVLPVGSATSVRPDDISSVQAFGGNQIGVFWGNQNHNAFYFAIHRDGAPDNVWTLETAQQGRKLADDHMDLKADSAGIVYAAVKTSLNDLKNVDENSWLVGLLVRETNGRWSWYGFSTIDINQTRPIVLLDETARTLYMFVTQPMDEATTGAIYCKQSSMDSIAFLPGAGTPFIASSTDTHINNATSTKHNLYNTTGLLVVAADDVSNHYLHNTFDLSSDRAVLPHELVHRFQCPESGVNEHPDPSGFD